jgi:hypothetical protein
MAKKARKKSAAKAKAKGKKKTRVLPKRAVRRNKAKAAAKNKKARRAKPAGLTDKIADAYHAVIDTFKGTDALRNKMEQRGTSESE